MTRPTDNAIELELDRLNAMNSSELRCAWRRLYHADAPRLSHDLLALGLAYKQQADAFGDLGKATKRKLLGLAKTFQEAGRVAATPSLHLKPGARLIREWHGRTIIVTVTEDGFEHDGAIYGSLTTVANKITGAHWSGPRFFGLLDKTKKTVVGVGSDVPGAEQTAQPDPSLLRIIVRARELHQRLEQDTELTVHDVASEQRLTPAYIYTLLRLR